MVARWRRPAKPRRVDAVPQSEIPVATEPGLGSQQAWRSAPALRRALGEPVPLVIAPGFTDRLATWRLAKMTVATRPARTWTSLTPLAPSAWTRRRGGARTSPDLAATGFAPDPGPVRWRSATGPGADTAPTVFARATAPRLPARPPRTAAANGAVGTDPLVADPLVADPWVALTRPTASSIRGQALRTPAVASAAGMREAARPDRLRTGRASSAWSAALGSAADS